jgi:hypothetical protein
MRTKAIVVEKLAPLAGGLEQRVEGGQRRHRQRLGLRRRCGR